MNRRNVGKIRVSSDLILQWIDFVGAEIKEARYDFATDTIELLIQSDELPEVDQRLEPPILNPQYIQFQDAMGNKIRMRKRD